ncbi:Cyanovirin-N [Mycena galopus ATCC 62051]|nr:Cyanovirin-N [Mycena galopus ATCC 62051]
MKSTLLSSIVFALCAFNVLGVPVDEEAPATKVERAADGGFLASCSNTNVNAQTDVLTTTCRNSAGGSVTSSINLNVCIGNANGKLVARYNGNFSGSCSGLTFLGTGSTATLISQCRNDGGTFASTSIDLNAVFTNKNGFLNCP